MLGHLMRAAGVGTARVDTVLDTPTASPGGQITGHVVITGGTGDQTFKGIRLDLLCSCFMKIDEMRMRKEAVFATVTLDSVSVAAGKVQKVPFTISVPDDAPACLKKTKIVLRTTLDASYGVDVTDTDGVEILPSRGVQTVLDAAKKIGLTLRSAEVEYNGLREYRFAQEFDFEPTDLPATVQEVEMSVRRIADGVQIGMSINRHGETFHADLTPDRTFVLGRADMNVENAAHVLRAQINTATRGIG